MDRQIVYPAAIPLETDILNTNKNIMVGLSKLAAAILGTTTLCNGLACVPTSPASLQVWVNPGEIYSLQNLDGTAYGSLAADTTHSVVKQGISLDQVTLSCPAPVTVGQSVNYLVQVTYSDTDTNATVLPYYNASNPAQAYSGPANSGTAQNTVRKGVCTIAVKAGVAATTGTQTTPAADSGYTGLYAVTVAYGQTTIVAGNIATVSGAPFITETLTQKISQATADARYVQSSSATGYDAAIKTIAASVATSALTISTPAAQTVNFRSATLSDGTVYSRTVAAQSLVVPSGATLGTIAAQQSRLAVIAIDNAGTPELAVTNIAAGKNLDESTLISTNAIATVATGTGVIAVTTGVLTISGSPTGTWQVGQIVQGTGVPAGTYITALGTGTGGAGTYQTNITTAVASTAMTGCAGMGVYSATARSNLPFRVLGYVESTQATAGTWATAPSTIQGCGGESFSSMGSIGYGQTYQNVTSSRVSGTTYYNTTGKPIFVMVVAQNNGASIAMNVTINGLAFGQVWGVAVATGQYGNVSFIVPPSQPYSVSWTGALAAWMELK